MLSHSASLIGYSAYQIEHGGGLWLSSHAAVDIARTDPLTLVKVAARLHNFYADALHNLIGQNLPTNSHVWGSLFINNQHSNTEFFVSYMVDFFDVPLQLTNNGLVLTVPDAWLCLRPVSELRYSTEVAVELI